MAADGVTLSVDLARSDLLLETELPRVAELVQSGSDGRRAYRLTPASLAAARDAGLSLPTLETWFQQRTGQPIDHSVEVAECQSCISAHDRNTFRPVSGMAGEQHSKLHRQFSALRHLRRNG